MSKVHGRGRWLGGKDTLICSNCINLSAEFVVTISTNTPLQICGCARTNKFMLEWHSTEEVRGIVEEARSQIQQHHADQLTPRKPHASSKKRKAA